MFDVWRFVLAFHNYNENFILSTLEDIRLVLKFSKSKSKNIVTNFHSLGTGRIPYTYIYLQILLAFYEGIGP